MDKSTSKLSNGLVLFLCLFFFQSLWIFQGLDVTDHGYHLTNQAGALGRHAPEHPVPMFFLADFVGGAWLRIINRPSILWARLGGVLLYSFRAFLSYKLLSGYFERARVFLAVLASAMFTTMRCPALIHYYSFPSLLVTLELLVLARLLERPTGSSSFKVYGFLLGVLTVPIVLARFPLVLIVFVPVALWCYYAATNRDTAGLKSGAPYVACGVVASAAVCALFYHAIGFLSTYAASVRAGVLGSVTGDRRLMVSEGYGLWPLLRRYLTGGRRVVSNTAVALVGIYAISWLKERLGRSARGPILVLLVLCGSLLLPFGRQVDGYAESLLLAALGLILGVACLFFRHQGERSDSLGAVVLVSVFVMLLSPLGSDTGLRKANYGMCVALALTFLIAEDLVEKARAKRLKSMCSLHAALMWSLCLVSVLGHFTNAYRDDPNRFKLRTGFRYGPVRHVYSRGGRVRVVDEALVKIDELTERGDTVLMVNGIPMFYYLTGTRPLFRSPWFLALPLARIRGDFEEAIENGKFPKLLVCCRTNTLSRDWPNDAVAFEEYLPKLTYVREKYIGELGYRLVWENDLCEIYSPPQELGVGEGD